MSHYKNLPVWPLTAQWVILSLFLSGICGCQASIGPIRDDKPIATPVTSVQLTEGTWWFDRPNLQAEHWNVLPDFDAQNHYQKIFEWNTTFVPKHVLFTWTALRTRGVDSNGGLSCGIATTALTDTGFTLDLLVAPNVQYVAGKWEGISP